MVKYDPNIIQQFADRLYSRARSVVIAWTLLGAIIGIAGGYMLPLVTDIPRPIGIIGILIFFGLLGYMIGTEWSFKLKLNAQVALCQVQIERNTRT